MLCFLKNTELRIAYAQRAVEYGWSRSVVEIHTGTMHLEREGQAVTDFTAPLAATGPNLGS